MSVAVEPAVPGTGTVESGLESVVVHAQGAICTRRARVTVPAGHTGEFRVRIGGIPLSAYAQSLRASVLPETAPKTTPESGPDTPSAAPAIRVTDVRPHLEAHTVAPADLPQLRRTLDEAREKARRATARRARLAAEIDATAALRAVPAKPRREDPYPRPPAVDQVLALADFVATRLADLHDRLRAADEACRRAEHDARVAGHRLDEASGSLRTAETRTTGAAVLTLVVPEPGSPDHGPAAREVLVDVEYQVPGARWVPQYQLRLDPAMTGGSLVMRAAVAQRTGEDWTGVRLGLSTADPDRRTDLPELRSLRIGRRQAAPPPSGWREPPSGLDELFAGYDTGARLRRERDAARDITASAAGAVGIGGYAAEPDEDVWYRAAGSPPPPPPMAAAPIAAPVPQAPGGFAGPPPMARARRRPGAAAAESRAYGGAVEGAAPAGAPPRPGADARFDAPPAGPPVPDADLLDYAGLVLAGPDAPGRGRLSAARGSDPVAEEYRRRAEAVAALALPAHAAAVRSSAGSYDYRFDVAAPADVDSDGGWHTVPVCTVEVELRPEFVCVPSVDEAVFGTVHVTNASAHALLAGPADVSVGGEFVTTVPLPTLAPGERQRVGIGVVESVQVARRAHMRESTAGLRGGTTLLEHTVEIDVANHLGREITLEVLERVPVSDEKDIRVEERPGDPAWQPDTELRDGRLVRGARVWRLAVPASGTRTLVGGYTVRIPTGKAVVGGNRRS
jgi:hypothetical protein